MKDWCPHYYDDWKCTNPQWEEEEEEIEEEYVPDFDEDEYNNRNF
jgi:hypothetical protein